jgi:formylglycine-generating enzyme required for sulfatase activity
MYAEAALLEGLQEADFRARARTVSRLASLLVADHVRFLIPLLADEYPQVRAAVIRALHRAGVDPSWRNYLAYECYVPAGPFLMGSDPHRDPHATSNEQPQRWVMLDAFYIGRYPITDADWKLYVDDRSDAHIPADWKGGTYPSGQAHYPARYLNWYDVQAYVRWAGMRMPTEAERQKAARGTDGWVYPWGDHWDASLCDTAEGGIYETTPVGSYSEAGGDSPYGLADAAGNVWEWVADWYDADYYRCRPNPDVNPTGPVVGRFRVMCGGAFCHPRSFARCAFRLNYYPYYRSRHNGGRWALSAVAEQQQS